MDRKHNIPSMIIIKLGKTWMNETFTHPCTIFCQNDITVNIDIFACIDFREFAKIGNLARIYIHVFYIIAFLWYNKIYFHAAYIFADIYETRITRKYVQCENVYIHSIDKSTPS